MIPFSELAARHDARIEDLALALAAELRPVDREAALARLDALAEHVIAALPAEPDPEDELAALVAVLAGRHEFTGDTESYDDPVNSMLDRVLERRRGLPITLSVLYVAVGHRAGIALAGFGLPGHYVCGHVGTDPPLLLDPFGGGVRVPAPAGAAPWPPHATALRMLNNLVGSYERRGDVGRAIRAAELRLALPVGDRTALETEARSLRARLN
jgi:hypothetical protein